MTSSPAGNADNSGSVRLYLALGILSNPDAGKENFARSQQVAKASAFSKVASSSEQMIVSET